jgi:hypothetical protein
MPNAAHECNSQMSAVSGRKRSDFGDFASGTAKIPETAEPSPEPEAACPCMRLALQWVPSIAKHSPDRHLWIGPC